MKFIHLTDPHVISGGLPLYGRDPAAGLAAAVADINARHADAEMVVMTGDLTNWAEKSSYQTVAECILPLTMPCVLLLGNHDDRANFRAVFTDGLDDGAGFVQGARGTPAGTFVFLDTHEPGQAGGTFCAKRRAWLEKTLAETEGPLFLFMHHPPFSVGIAYMDNIALEEPETFAAVVRPHAARIRHLFFGHVHRAIAGSWLGIPLSNMRGTNHQVWLELTGRTDTIRTSPEQPAYGVVLVDDDRMIVHLHEYANDGPSYAFAPPEGVSDREYATKLKD
ncbi:MAG TPA: phosphodiesterase [Afifellaceae bacterium]|nr:phosphodiesterase [Afifellaceae bacterium]